MQLWSVVAASIAACGLVSPLCALPLDPPTSRFDVARAGAQFRAWHPGLSWHVEFDGRGSRVWPAHGDWTWGLELTGIGRPGALRDLPDQPSVELEGPRLTYRWDAGLSEWYENRSEGLEHGFTLHARPEGWLPWVELRVAIRGGLRAEASGDGRDVRFHGSDGRVRLDYADLKVFDASGTPLAASWEPCEDEMTLRIDDANAIYPLTVDPIAQIAYLKSIHPDRKDSFGSAVAMSGDRIVLGARMEDGGASGVGGDPTNNSVEDSGAAYVYVRELGDWRFEAYLKPERPVGNQFFGTVLALDGNAIVVGAPNETFYKPSTTGYWGEDSILQAGAAYLYALGPAGWSLEARLQSIRPESLAQFGNSMAIDGDFMAIGAQGESVRVLKPVGHMTSNFAKFAGAVYLFERRNGNWVFDEHITAPNAAASGLFGGAVALEGDLLAIGAPGDPSSSPGVDGDMFAGGSPGSGAVHVYERIAGSWTFAHYIKSVDPDWGEGFGQVIALSEDALVVGVPEDDSTAHGVNGDPFADSWTAQASGAAYVFRRSSNTWTQEAYLKASTSKSQLRFGHAVAIDGATVVVGTPHEKSPATGIHGSEGPQMLSGAGAAYLFEPSGSTWKQTAYVKASNTETGDGFGASLTIDGGYLIVGAPGEDGGTPGPIGDPQDNSADGAGAAFVFNLNADFTPYCAQTKPTSVPGCFASLSCSDPSLATGRWQATSIPRSDFAGPGTSVGVFLYTHGVGIGASPVKSTPSYGLLCLAGFQASAPAYRPALLEGALPGVCNSGFMSLPLSPAAAPLGLAVGEDVNVQLWYRDPAPPANSRLSNAIHYTLQ
jgi:hypothetical protein